MDPDIQRLLDDNAIRRLTAYYSDAITHLDPIRAASVYTEGGRVAIAGHEIVGRAAIEEGMRTTFAEFSLLQLIEHGGVIDLDGDRARARWSTIELTVRREAQDLNVVFGRYEDELVHQATGWFFERRTFSLAGRARLETAKLQADPRFASLASMVSEWPGTMAR